eukprot:4499634-Pleurochrysis_carterae.AAC.1
MRIIASQGGLFCGDGKVEDDGEGSIVKLVSEQRVAVDWPRSEACVLEVRGRSGIRSVSRTCGEISASTPFRSTSRSMISRRDPKYFSGKTLS